MTERELRALRGHLVVLLAMVDELEAIGASPARRAHHQIAIAEVRSQLGSASGDLTDATSDRDS